ncbi:MAG: PfkB family carbohydrate kinase, partial [Candidatus Sericytochromatia bacterium]
GPPAHIPWGIGNAVAGVGFNVSLALRSLGHPVDFVSRIGPDLAGRLVLEQLRAAGIATAQVQICLRRTPQSVVLYDPDGQSKILTDPKDMQELAVPFAPGPEIFDQVELAVLSNIQLARPLLSLAKARGIPVATDLQALSDLDDPYQQDFLAHADILFFSAEALPCAVEAFVAELRQRFAPEIVVVGLGAAGAYLSTPALAYRVPAQHVRPLVNPVGAGDALFAAFLHFHRHYRDPHLALSHAMTYCAYKLGASGGAAGLLTEPSYYALRAQLHFCWQLRPEAVIQPVPDGQGAYALAPGIRVYAGPAAVTRLSKTSGSTDSPGGFTAIVVLGSGASVSVQDPQDGSQTDFSSPGALLVPSGSGLRATGELLLIEFTAPEHAGVTGIPGTPGSARFQAFVGQDPLTLPAGTLAISRQCPNLHSELIGVAIPAGPQLYLVLSGRTTLSFTQAGQAYDLGLAAGDMALVEPGLEHRFAGQPGDQPREQPGEQLQTREFRGLVPSGAWEPEV